MSGDRPCDDNRLFIEQYVDGELSYAEGSEIANHIKHCSACRSYYEKIHRLKELMRTTAQKERLSSAERLAFENLIQESSKPHRLSPRSLFDILPRPALLLAGVTIGTVLFVSALYAYLTALDHRNDLLIAEIMQVHESKLPDEFLGSDDIESALRKNLDLPRAHLPRFVKEQPVVKARFSHLGPQPVASMKITGPHGKGTLLVTRPHRELKSIFANGACVPDLTCRAQRLSRNGKDMLFWEGKEGNYVFIADDRRMGDHLARLINAEEF